MKFNSLLSYVMTYLGFMGACLLLSCGGSPKEDTEARIAKVVQQLHDTEEQLAEDDDDGRQSLEKIRKKLKTVNELMFEAEYDKAQTVLDGVAQTLEDMAPDSLVGQSRKDHGMIRGFGLARYQGWNDDALQKLTGDEDLSEIRILKTEARAVIFINMPDGTELTIPSQSEVSVLNYNRARNRLQLALKNGGLSVYKNDIVGEISVQLADLNVTAAGVVTMELENRVLTDFRYAVVHLGRATWSTPSNKGDLNRFFGIVWEQDDWMETEVPASPRPESPDNNETVSTGKGRANIPFQWFSQIYIGEYQIQVADRENFVTRIYDKSNLTESKTSISLKPGEYFWRVRGFSEEKVPGPFSKSNKLYVSKGTVSAEVIKKRKGISETKLPGPKIQNVEIESHGYSVIVKGRAADGARIKVNGVSAVILPSGEFNAIIEFEKSGIQTVRVVAMDPDTGAESFQDHKVRIVQ